MHIPSGRPVFRLLGRVLGPPLTLWAVWVVAAQIFLLTPIFRAVLNRESPAIHIRYRWAWSVWPGTVHVRGLVLTSQDRRVQWQLDFDRVTTSISLTDLPRKLFHATKIRADGMTFALRRRIPKYQVTPEKLEGLPRIEGFPAVPLGEEGPDYDTPDWDYHLWSVWLQDADATSVRQIWVDRIRLEGGSHLSGAFYLKPMRQVRIDPAVIEGKGLVFADDGARVLSDLQLAPLRVKLGPFDPRATSLETFLRSADADVEGNGHFDGLEAFQHLFPGERLSGGTGPVPCAIHVQAGQLLPPSSFSAELSRVALRRGRVAANALGLSAVLDLPAGPPPLEARARIDLRGIASAGARVESLASAIDGVPRDLANLSSPRRVQIDVRGGRVDDARAIAEALGVRGRVEEGKGTFSAHLEGPPDRLAGGARVALSGLRARAASATLSGNLAVDVRVHGL